MKYEEVQSTLETYFKGLWTSTPLTFENVFFDSSEVSEFARFSVQFGESAQRALGGNCYRIIGVAFLQIFIKPNIGTFRLTELADIAAGHLANKRVALGSGFIHLWLPSLAKSTAARDGWVMGNLSCPFYFDSEMA
jgi:hypothetical protein